MPLNDPEKRKEYQRRVGRLWYLENREKTVARSKAYKIAHYSGTCRNCGGQTIGNSPTKIPEWCSKPECASAQRKQPKGDR